MIEGAWSANYGNHHGTLTITTGTGPFQISPYQWPTTVPIGGTYPTGPLCPVGLPGVQGPPGPQIPIDPEPSEEMVKLAEKLLYDPEFEVGKFLARILAKHITDNIDKYRDDEVVKKYLSEK